MFTTVAFIESVDPAGTYNPLTAIPDQHVTVTGDDLRVPELNQIVAVAGGIETAVESFLRLVAPSLRARSPFYVEPYNTAAAAAVEPGSPHRVVDLRGTPLVLVPQENLNAETNSNPVAAQIQWAILWLANGPVEPVKGPIFSVAATGATALVASTWVNVPLTLVDDLPRGRYQLVGLRARSAGMVAARLVFVGGRWRPGVLGVDAQDDQEHEMFRYGGLGVFGEFEDVDLPSVDCLAVSADAAEDFVLDLIQVRSGPA
ncbi:MAG TPA: hypothetical protein VGX21_08300 [Methylomirabilota bacterium]|jgi:hypothetical protein|nr:hypothetical protein [Methylomirabilota bacterium]